MELRFLIVAFITVFPVFYASGYGGVPELMQDQPARVQPGPSLLDREQNDEERRINKYRARALELLKARARAFKSPGCPEIYTKLSENHTMCLTDVGFETRLPETVRHGIVKQHNRYRSRVSPTASNMQKMVWDDSLAKIAAKWARQCRRGHDKGDSRRSPDLPGVYVGQNAAYGYRNWQTAIEAWHDEVSDFQYGKGAINDSVVGHYTQIVAWRSARVGCGQADCPKSEYKRHYVCNYAVGQMNDDPLKPYSKGERCGGCPDNCVEAENLCDCDGLLCLNGGKVDLTKCRCKCPAIYKGEVCQTLQCPEEDPWYCGSQWPESYCTEFANVPLECPYMCGSCSAADKNSTNEVPDDCRLQCKNDGKLDRTKCVCSCPEGFSGDRCERKARVCDGKTCLNGGQLNTKTCQCACPIGLTGKRCETKIPVCGGKACQNRARLNTATCKCQCRQGFTGSLCETSLPVCEEITCKNGGRVNETTCTCTCPKQFTGKRCHRRKCADADCSNGATLDYADCSCKCREGFTGMVVNLRDKTAEETSLVLCKYNLFYHTPSVGIHTKQD
ncbi:hypothetical protein BaRGS_00024960 [Batillaria attramentaria]|uniref:EGF-like domain-containing protein n=1 Tax=Batillaria attramentaria TaxID=370345 RepID=A0ABD0K9E8_9CAEN